MKYTYDELFTSKAVREKFLADIDVLIAAARSHSLHAAFRNLLDYRSGIVADLERHDRLTKRFIGSRKFAAQTEDTITGEENYVKEAA